MKIGAIIAEYNPFHNGHKFQIEEFKKNHGITHLLAVMSGNFVQRGAPAVFDKFTRAEFALDSGVDLVLELPSYFSTQTAEIFSKGAVLSLNSLGCVDKINFGSESGDIKILDDIAKFLVYDERYEIFLKKFLSYGDNFPTSRERSIRSFFELDKGMLSMSNNILAIEYLKEMHKNKSTFKPTTIVRKVGEHKMETIEEDFYSASSIRNYLSEVKNTYKPISDKNNKGFLKLKKIDNSDSFLEKIRDFIPEKELIRIEELFDLGIVPVELEDFFSDICMAVIREEKLEDFFEIGEGLENLIKKKIPLSQNLSEAVDLIRSKRYSKARIRRCLFNILLGIKKEDMDIIKRLEYLPYIRVLGFNKAGTEILKKVKSSSDIDIVMSPAKAKKSKLYKDKVYKMMMDFDLKSSLIYYQKFYRNNRKILAKGEPDYLKLVKRF